MLMETHKATQKSNCMELIDCFEDEDEDFLSCIITGDEFYYCNLETKQKSMEWRHKMAL
jgi:hypothetical protein